MAIQIYDRIYSKGEAGYNAVTADITSWFSWDEIDGETVANSTIFKKYLDDTQTKYAYIKTNLNNGYSPRIFAGVYNGYQNVESGMLSDITYSRAAVTDKGLVVIASSKVLTAATASNQFAAFGIYPGTDPFTEEHAACVFMLSNSVYVLSSDSVESKSNAFTLDGGSLGLTAAVPLCSSTTNFVVDDIQRLTIVPDNGGAVSQSITFNGEAYHRLGWLLIPE